MSATERRHANSGVSAEPQAPRPGLLRRTVDVIDERMGISGLRYPVPEHANSMAWSLGGVTAATLGILIVTGVILSQFYVPDPTQANQSVREISTDVWGGQFVRGLHYWAAHAMYVLAALHLIRVFVTASYKKPREGNWLIGASMFVLTFLAIFTGTVLKWDQEGFEALDHNIEVAELIGAAGVWFSPSFAENIPILDRLYSAHVVLIPGLILLLLFVHVLLIKYHGISPHPLLGSTTDGHAPREEPTESFTRHLRRASALSLVVLGTLGLLTQLSPPGVGTPPVSGMEITRPPWLFWPLFTLENWFGLTAIVWGSAILFGLIFLVPFVDRNPARHPSRRKVALTLGAVFLIVYLVLTLLMLFVPTQQHLGM